MDGTPEPGELRTAMSPVRTCSLIVDFRKNMTLLRQIFNTENTSGGNVINNNGDYFETRYHIHLSPGLEHSRGELSLDLPLVGQSSTPNPRLVLRFTPDTELNDTSLPQPSIPFTSPLIPRLIPSASHLAIEVQALIRVVLKMRQLPVFRSSVHLFKTLVSLQQILRLTELATMAYGYTPLADSLSHALAEDLKSCQELLVELLSRRLPSWKCTIRDKVLRLLRKYARRQERLGLADELDLKLGRYHNSLAACLLAVGQ